MKTVAFSLAAVVASALGLPGGEPPKHFQIEATFEAPAAPGEAGAIAVRFAALDADVRVNEVPPPRLRLDAAQHVLVDRQEKPTEVPVMDPEHPRYIEPDSPVRFRVGWAADPPPGIHAVGAELVYFYCSKSRGWCRRGTADLEVAVEVGSGR